MTFKKDKPRKRPRIKELIRSSKNDINTPIVSSTNEDTREIIYTPKRTFGKHYSNGTTF